MASILVTGCEGFIGNALARALVRSNHDVKGIDLCEPSAVKPVYDYIQGDIRRISDLELATKGVEIIYHFAAISNLNVSRSVPLETIKTNVMGTANLCDISLQKGIKIVFASSDHVYGTQRRRIVSETAPPSPNEIYAASKAAGEYVIKHFGVRNTVLRLGTSYGPRMRRELVIYIFLSKALRGESISIHSPGTQKRQFVFVDDIVDASISAMTEKSDGQVFNIPGSEATSVVDLAKACIELAESRSELTFIPARMADIDFEFVSFEKAKRLLHWQPRVTLKQGLALTMQWIRVDELSKLSSHDLGKASFMNSSNA